MSLPFTVGGFVAFALLVLVGVQFEVVRRLVTRVWADLQDRLQGQRAHLDAQDALLERIATKQGLSDVAQAKGELRQDVLEERQKQLAIDVADLKGWAQRGDGKPFVPARRRDG